MYQFWETIIRPVAEAVTAERIVEIGALRAQNTENIIKFGAENCVVHVIDPAPSVPDEHWSKYGDRVVFHKALSLDVLPGLPPFDLGLIDGDHNWYTVYHELKAIEAVHRQAAKPMPALVFHDVGWPYGRRDLYYNPSTIPDEFRQPYAKQGMVPGRSELVAEAGVNPQLDNAIREGGPRNGVLTAIEDFLAESGDGYRFELIPVYFGFGILISQDRLALQPQLAAAIDHILSPDNLKRMLRTQEDIMISFLVTLQRINAQKQDLERMAAGQAPSVTANTN